MSLPRSYSKGEDDFGATVIAIDGEKNSQSAVKWAVDNIVNTKNPHCSLVHVQCKTMQMGDRSVHGPNKEGGTRAPTQEELQQFFLPYRGFCARRGVETKEIVIHDIDVPSALIDYIFNNSISNIVLGASNRNAILRKFKQPDIPTTLLKSAPESCAVYVISKGKVQTFRLASRPYSYGSTHSNRSTRSPHHHLSPANSLNYTSSPRHPSQWELPQGSFTPPLESPRSFLESWKSECSDKISPEISTIDSPQRSELDKFRLSTKTNSPSASTDDQSLEFLLRRDSISDGSESSSGPISIRSSDLSYENVDFSPKSATSKNSLSLAHLLDAEMRRLRIELQQSMQLFNSVTKETSFAKHVVRELHRLQTLESKKPEDAKLVEGATSTLAEMEKHKKRAAFEAVQTAKKIADLEMQKRNTEIKAQSEAEERTMSTESLASPDFRCRKYTIDEIEIATDHFADSYKIGEGAYGPVFKGMLNYIPVAIKILRPDLSQGQKQFKQEVDVLSSMRHPHMVILLGACPEYGCLVYEYMENGSLEDRLVRKDNTPPLPWRTRFKIAYEIATALLFLHETKPEPVVHRDLKPANILLDRNYVSKLGDVGLARLIPPNATDSVTQYYMTSAAGTFCYIDPEYQQTGLLGVKSDVYSFGVVLLQLLTARSPMGLSYQVENSIEAGMFSIMLDPALTDWPVEDCLSLANIAVKCCELRKKDRPDLATDVLPELSRLRNLAMDTKTIEPAETTITLPSPVDLISYAQSHSSEINAKRRWHQWFKSVSEKRSSKSSFSKSMIDDDDHSSPLSMPSRGRRSIRRSKMALFTSCCSSLSFHHHV